MSHHVSFNIVWYTELISMYLCKSSHPLLESFLEKWPLALDTAKYEPLPSKLGLSGSHSSVAAYLF